MKYTRSYFDLTKSDRLLSWPAPPAGPDFEAVRVLHAGRYRRLLLAASLAACALLLLARTAAATGWTLISAPPAAWTAIACSADGRKLAAACSGAASLTNGAVYTSTNYGQTWALSFVGPGFVFDVASSVDGSRLAAACVSNTPFPLPSGPSPIFVSSDAGASWTPSGAPLRPWRWVASSGDGHTLLATDATGTLAFSTNAGVTWGSGPAPAHLFYFGCSADGSKLFAEDTINGILYVSTNAGATWGWHGLPGGELDDLILSADGRRLIGLGSRFGLVKLYTSTDLGVTWQASDFPTSQCCERLAAAADGSVLVYGTINTAGGLYLSTDAGLHWTQTDASGTNWVSLAASADGSRLFAASYLGIYTYYVPPTPTLNVAVSNTNLVLSWTVPSTNFVLQQAAGLENPNWEAVTNAPALNLTNLHYEITAPAAHRKAFYRLATP